MEFKKEKINWFDLRNDCLIKLKDDLLNELVEKAIRTKDNLYRLSKETKLSYQTLFYIRKRKSKYILVRKLKSLAEYLNINFNYFDDKIEELRKGKIASIKNPKFPIDLKCKEGAYLLGCVVSDGTMYRDKKARNVIRTKYANNEEELLNRLVKCIKKIFGEVHIQKEINRGNIIIKIGSSIIGESLESNGGIVGNKTNVNAKAPWLIIKYPELDKYYLNAIFGDEGTVGINGKFPYISLTRYNDIDNILKNEEKELLGKSGLLKVNKFPTGHKSSSLTYKKAITFFSDETQRKIKEKGIARLLKDETKLLKRQKIKTRIWNGKVVKTHNGHYRLATTMIISRKESIVKFYKEIGFSLERKQKRLEQSLKEVKWINGA